MALVVNDSNFSETIASGKLVMVDFWATWCGPCRMLSPIVDEIANEMGDKMIVAKCNVDECDNTPVEYGIRNIPALLFFKDGKLADRLVGAVPKATIVEKINSLL
ncbi:MAG: thioredoxin [Bacteroidetes bacterium]|uniref:Thioredoxin n=1 Tax=Candidatus Merdivivens pullistercoris TaxID=2840873 RepID=A0A9D9I276_9BACT|nr:thioredoxin [Candidatus Merdivivens pullistercoris]